MVLLGEAREAEVKAEGASVVAAVVVSQAEGAMATAMVASREEPPGVV